MIDDDEKMPAREFRDQLRWGTKGGTTAISNTVTGGKGHGRVLKRGVQDNYPRPGRA